MICSFILCGYVPVFNFGWYSVSNAIQSSQPTQATNSPQQAENQPIRRGLRKPTPTKKFNWEEKKDPESLK